MRRGHSQFGESHRPAPADGPGPFLLLWGQVRKLWGGSSSASPSHVGGGCGSPSSGGRGSAVPENTHTEFPGPDCLPWAGHWEPWFTLTLGSQARGSVWVTLGSTIPFFFLTPFLLGAIPLVGTGPRDRGIALVGCRMEFCSQTLTDPRWWGSLTPSRLTSGRRDGGEAMPRPSQRWEGWGRELWRGLPLCPGPWGPAVLVTPTPRGMWCLLTSGGGTAASVGSPLP